MQPSRLIRSVAAACLFLAPAAAAQEMSDAEIEAYISERCSLDREHAHGALRTKVELSLTLTEAEEARFDEAMESDQWRRPGYWKHTWRLNPETGFTSITPLAAVTAAVEANGDLAMVPLSDFEVALDCIGEEDCGVTAYVDGFVMASGGGGADCHNAERVLDLLDVWVERNVDRVDGAPPLVE